MSVAFFFFSFTLLGLATAAAPDAGNPATLSSSELIARGREALKALGPYRVTLTKEERINGKLLPAQEIQLMIREEPYAARAEYVRGPAHGRRLFYDSKVRPDEIRIREGGALGFVGAIWLSLHSKLAFKDTKHSAKELGFGPLLDQLELNAKHGDAFGGLVRHDEGPDSSGNYCLVFTAPKGATGLYAQRTRLCLDLKLNLPVRVECEDSSGLFERFVFTNVQPLSPGGPDPFTAKAAGL